MSTSPGQKNSVWMEHISGHFPITKIRKKMAKKKEDLGWIYHYKLKLQSDQVSELKKEFILAI